MLFRDVRAAVVAALVGSVVTLSGSRACADPPVAPVDEAQLRFEAGSRALAGGDAPTALREFEAAQSLRPSPVLSYYIGTAHDQMGQACVAVAHYRQYLAEVPTADNRAPVEERIAAVEPFCQAAPVAPPAAAPASGSGYTTASAQASAAPLTVQPHAPVKKRIKPWKVWVTVGVLGTVATVVIVGAVLIASLPDSSGGSSHHHWDFDLRAPSAAPTANVALLRF